MLRTMCLSKTNPDNVTIIYVSDETLNSWHHWSSKTPGVSIVKPKIKSVRFFVATTDRKRALTTGQDEINIDIDKFETPDDIDRIKRFMKENSVLAGRAKRRECFNDDGGRASNEAVPPFPTSRLLLAGKYVVDTFSASNEDQLQPTIVHDSDSLDQAVTRHAQRYLESIITFEAEKRSFWFFVTSLDAFVHGKPMIDDCADKSMVHYEEKLVA